MKVMRILMAVLTISAQGVFALNAKVCEFALDNTKRLIPDLCETLDSNSALASLWEEASKSGQAKIIPGLLLAGGAFLFGATAMVNASDNTGTCSGHILEGNPEECGNGEPVLPLLAVSGIFAVSDIIFLTRPNAKLAAAIRATREIQNGKTRMNPEANRSPADSPDLGESEEMDCGEIRDRVLLFECNRKKRTGVKASESK